MKDSHALMFAGTVLVAVGYAFDGFVGGLIGFFLVGFGAASTVTGAINAE